MPVQFKVVKPTNKQTGTEWDQTGDAATNMRYVHSLGLPSLMKSPFPRMGAAVVVGGAPSIKDHLEEIRELAADKNNCVFALNWTHTWLIDRGIIPRATVFFEIDVEPDTVLKKAHKDVIYFICSHCDRRTFDALNGYTRVVWHSPPNSDAEKVVADELFPQMEPHYVGGGINSFTRTITISLMLGYRNIHLFGCDASFPEGAKSTHVEGYETVNDVKTDTIPIYAKDESTGEIRKFLTVGYLALQVEEFKEYCRLNHHFFALRVHGKDGLLYYVHSRGYPHQYAGLAR